MLLSGAVVCSKPSAESLREVTLRCGEPTAVVPPHGDSVMVMRNGLVIEVRPIIDVMREEH